jgi:septal ring factor EnvC (AmiA/AmiB activator)
LGRTGITYQEVSKAIATLQGQQKTPTVDHIREILGTGSKSTIARFLREWKAKQGLQNEDTGRLPTDLLALVTGLWDRLQEKVDKQTIEYQQTSDTKIAEIQQELHQCQHRQTEGQLKIHQLEEQLHQQTEENTQLKSALANAQQAKIIGEERATALEYNQQESKAENQRLHQLLKHVQKNFEHYQSTTQNLREEQSLLAEKQQNEYEQRLSLLLGQVNTAISEKYAYQAQYEQLAKSHESLMAEHEMLKQQEAEIRSQYEILKITCNKNQQDYEILKGENKAYVAELTALQHTTLELQFSIKSKDEKISFQEGAIAKANDKIGTLRHEYQFALHEKSVFEGQLKQALSSSQRRVSR